MHVATGFWLRHGAMRQWNWCPEQLPFRNWISTHTHTHTPQRCTIIMSSMLFELPDEMRCKYPSKRCDNVRVLKRDGDLHRFCEFHRLKANMNQQRLEQRRRMATSPRTTTRTPKITKRTKRSMGTSATLLSVPMVSASASCSPTDAFDSDEVVLPTLRMDDLDLDLLGGLLEVPQSDPLHADDMQTVLCLLENESSARAESNLTMAPVAGDLAPVLC
jgi:hypothetical protein